MFRLDIKIGELIQQQTYEMKPLVPQMHSD